MQIEWVKTLWKRAAHSAFTDLCLFQDRLLCCFREAGTHVSADGTLRVVDVSWNGEVQQSTRLTIPGADLRDPKLTVTPSGNLLLLGYARFTRSDGSTLFSQPMCWQSQDGKSWSSGKALGDQNWWLWRLRWHKDQAFGFAYNRYAQMLRLYQGAPRRTFECIQPEAFSLKTQGKGYPNETDLWFGQDDTAYCLLRRDADTCTAQLGTSRPPYKRWHWQDLGVYIGGPVALPLAENRLLVAGRKWQNFQASTTLWLLDKNNAKVSEVMTLPSAGDTSYPGLVRRGNTLYVSYYSSHIDNKSAVYLAKISDIESMDC